VSWLTLLFSFLEIGVPGDQIAGIVTAKNSDLLIAGSILVEEDDGIKPVWSHADTYIARLSPDDSAIKWEKSYGWIKDDHAYALGEYSDETIQVVGDTWSSGNGFSDAYFMLLDQTGEMIWEQDFGGKGIDTIEAFTFLKMSIVAVGTSASYGGIIYGLPWAVGLSQDGQTLWNTVVGQENAGRFHDVVRARNGVVAVGEIDISPDLEETDSAVRHVLIAKFSEQGDLLWEKHYWVRFNPEARAIVRLNDGGFLIAGSTQKMPLSSRDGFVLRVNSNGKMVWLKFFGGTMDDVFTDLVIVPSKRFLAIGATKSFDATSTDVWFYGASLSGMTFLNERFGSSTQEETGNSLVRRSDGSFAFTGSQYVGQFALTKQ
jgi:hypothetical protein